VILSTSAQKEQLGKKLDSAVRQVRKGINIGGTPALSRDQRENLSFQSRAIRDFELLAAHVEDLRGQLSPASVPSEDSDFGFESFGQQLFAIRSASMGYTPDPRLERRGVPAGGSERYPSDGGFLVAPAFSRQLLDRVAYSSTVFSRAWNIPVAAKNNGIKLPGIDEQSRVDGSRWGGVRMYWQNEADATISTRPKFRLAELTFKKLIGSIVATDELTTDAAAFGDWALRVLALEASWKLDDMSVNGDGNGKGQGVMAASCLITVPKDSGQASATITPSNLTGMLARLLPECYDGAVWLLSPQVFGTLCELSLAVGIAGSWAGVITPPDADAPYGRLLTRPIVLCQQCSRLGTTGDIILADMSYLGVIERISMSSSMHVNFVSDQNIWRLVYRADSTPMLHTPIAPANGDPTQSCFVALASR
jgi:HK97 family phage major capsid protein